MKTLGIDLATEPHATASCLIDWGTGTVSFDGDGTDSSLLDAMSGVDRVGIDAPFGWPDAFRDAVEAWGARGEWIGGNDRKPLQLRQTDVDAIQVGARPMSVSTNLLGSTSMRCAYLLAEHRERTGTKLDRVHGQAVEVYPAGSLAAWGTTSKGYKGSETHALRDEIVSFLDDRGDLGLDGATRDRCTGSDHALDALICSLTARAAALGLVREVTVTQQLAREGWIHLPTPDSLGHLRDGS